MIKLPLYQIRVEGDSACFDSAFIMRSKDIYLHKPTDPETAESIDKVLK